MEQRRALRSTVGPSFRPIDEAKNYCLSQKDKPGLEVKYINDFIGSGVFATKRFQKGDFLLEYKGEHISDEEGEKRDEQYSSKEGNFLFFFGNKCIDATFSSGKGRMVNDEVFKKANCVMKAVKVNNDDFRLCLFAKCNIESGTELRYDYGIPDLPWRQKRKQDGSHLLKTKSKECGEDNLRFDVDQAHGTDKICRETRGSNEISDLPVKDQQSAEKSAESQMFQQLALSHCEEKGESRAPVGKNNRENPDQTSSSEHDCECHESEGETNTVLICEENGKQDGSHLLKMKSKKFGDGNLRFDVSQARDTDQDCRETSCNNESPDPHFKDQQSAGKKAENQMFQQLVLSQSREKGENGAPEERNNRNQAQGTDQNCIETSGNNEISDLPVKDQQIALSMSQCGEKEEFRVPEERNKRENTDETSAKENGCECRESEGETNTCAVLVCDGKGTQDESHLPKMKSKEFGDCNLRFDVSQAQDTDQDCRETSGNNEIPDLYVKDQQSAGKSAENLIFQLLSMSQCEEGEIRLPEERNNGENPDQTSSKEYDWECHESEGETNPLLICEGKGTQDESHLSRTNSKEFEDANLGFDVSQAQDTDKDCRETSDINEISDLPVINDQQSAENQIFQQLALSQCGEKEEIRAPEERNSVENPDQTSSKEYDWECHESEGETNTVLICDDENLIWEMNETVHLGQDSFETGGIKEMSNMGFTKNHEKTKVKKSILPVPIRVSKNTVKIPPRTTEYVSDSWDSASDVNDPDYKYDDSDSRDSDSDGSQKSKVIPVYKSGGSTVCSDTSASSSIPDAQKYVRPKRPCPFCGIFQSRLSRHLQLVHNNEKEVSDAMNAPKEERMNLFSKFRKQGILQENKHQAKQANPMYQQERKNRTTSKKVVMCGNCNGFYHSRFLGRHKRKCFAESCEIVANVPLSVLSNLDDNTDGFLTNVLSKMRDDEIGIICKKDPIITLIGKRIWMKNRLKQDKKGEVKKLVMTSMRRLGSLYKAFLSQQEELGQVHNAEGTAADMFSRRNFKLLEQAIHVCTVKGDGSTLEDLKHGLKTGLYYLIKTACKYLKGTYLIEDADEKAAEVDKFLHVFELSHDALFGDAAYAMHKSRNEKLRKPEILPLEEDIQKVREHTISRIDTIMKDSYSLFDSHAFIELRDLLVCRLTLFNARRGGEPCRLRLSEWKDAEKNAWISEEEIEKLDDPLDRSLAKDLKVTYQTGKGNKHLVPVLMPNDTIMALKKIADEETRSQAGVSKKNVYLFPSTQNSEYHVSGWHAVSGICGKLNLEKADLLTATKNRHRVSTLYAAMEIPEAERRFFYSHMGHSKEINEDVYQAPLALMEVLKVGRSLHAIDGMAPGCTKMSLPGPSGIVSTKSKTADNSDSSTDDSDKDCIEKATSSKEKSRKNLRKRRADSSADVSDKDGNENETSSKGKSRKNLRKRRAVYPSTVSQDSSEDDTDEDCNEKVTNSQGKSANLQKNISVRKYVQWNKCDADKVLQEFKNFIEGDTGRKLPSRQQIEDFKQKNGVQHDWTTIKTKVFNERTKRKKIALKRFAEMEMLENTN